MNKLNAAVVVFIFFTIILAWLFTFGILLTVT